MAMEKGGRRKELNGIQMKDQQTASRLLASATRKSSPLLFLECPSLPHIYAKMQKIMELLAEGNRPQGGGFEASQETKKEENEKEKKKSFEFELDSIQTKKI